ncbi:hypothetical protein B0G84_3290 [Paraburkholderia sp. BL8N3]|nr:HEPN domain-containing protein [Paraburkholderia sp. BL8N3]TCK37989.1 hypothetical protein B0G84_3290 [Paraburkholderia sp. BL8N3]
MPLELREKCLQELRASLVEQLGQAQIHNGNFISLLSLAGLQSTEDILPKSGPVHERIKSTLGDSPFVEFVYSTLSRELFEAHEFSSEKGRAALSSLSEYADLEALAGRLIETFQSLPWKYAVTVRMPFDLGPRLSNEGVFEVSEDIRILRGSGAIKAEYPLVSGIEKRDREIAGTANLLSIFVENYAAWQEDASYLQFDVEGYIGTEGVGDTFDGAVSAMRSFYGLAIATMLFNPFRWPTGQKTHEKAYVHRRTGKGWIVEQASELNPQLSDAINALDIHVLHGRLPNGTIDSWIGKTMRDVSVVFKAGAPAHKIRLAARWLFDCYSGKDELLKFVQAAIVIEILLGDKDTAETTGLSNLLANRCAYLIAASHTERTNLIADFKRIYDVRSNIVHQGKTKLSHDEKEMFNKLLLIAHRVIRSEMQLLVKDQGF